MSYYNSLKITVRQTDLTLVFLSYIFFNIWVIFARLFGKARLFKTLHAWSSSWKTAATSFNLTTQAAFCTDYIVLHALHHRYYHQRLTMQIGLQDSTREWTATRFFSSAGFNWWMFWLISKNFLRFLFLLKESCLLFYSRKNLFTDKIDNLFAMFFGHSPGRIRLYSYDAKFAGFQVVWYDSDGCNVGHTCFVSRSSTLIPKVVLKIDSAIHLIYNTQNQCQLWIYLKDALWVQLLIVLWDHVNLNSREI